jgi:hypothetical protein
MGRCAGMDRVRPSSRMNTQWLLFWCRQSMPFWRATVWRSPICQSSWVRRIEARSLAAAFMRHDTAGEIATMQERRRGAALPVQGERWRPAVGDPLYGWEPCFWWRVPPNYPMHRSHAKSLWRSCLKTLSTDDFPRLIKPTPLANLFPFRVLAFDDYVPTLGNDYRPRLHDANSA